tara:strand:- start:704 stop:1708 length:1005 start_codon:yes stop_codon:yes gene_type:complete
MAFLDNSGDIILDAVLTDTGRFRMARGDFRISKFALGDDEIDYSLFNKNHPSGSAYYDLEVLRTPLMEALTNNTSTMKSKLLTITRTNILHLPVLKLLDGGNAGGTGTQRGIVPNTALNTTTKSYIVTCTKGTEDVLSTLIGSTNGKGIIRGSNATEVRSTSNYIALERGLDTLDISPQVTMPATLQETQFIIEMDYRLGSIVDRLGTPVPVSFIDDDQIASYYVSAGATDTTVPVVVDALDKLRQDEADSDGFKSLHNIRGPRDRVVQFKIAPSINLTSSDFLFDKLGTSQDSLTIDGFNGAQDFKFIDSIVRVTSATTAYSINIPVRYIKKV